jgi:histidine triad (HIT) family protein
MISKEQAEKFKNQILQQIQKWNKPENQKQQAINQIQSMTPEQLEQFLIQNNMLQSSQPNQQTNNQPQQCPFCLISQGKIKSYKIAENNYAVAVLEINPISKGHTLIIPKQHKTIEKIPIQTFLLVQQVIQVLKQKLNPKQIQLSTGQIQEHSILNIIPLTGEEKGEREKMDENQLQKLQQELIGNTQQSPQTKQPGKKSKKKLPQVKRRVP